MSIGELIQIKKILFLDQLFVIRNYYRKSFRFAIADLLLCFFALVFNPYRVSRRFLQKKGEKNLYVYGETPLKTLHRIADFCNLGASDTFLELGSGRGKGCFWISSFVGCKTVGVEWIPLFSKVASFLAKMLRFDSLSFFCEDFQKSDFSKATFVYLYSTSMSDQEIEDSVKKMEERLPNRAKVLTVSEPLNHFRFKQIRSFPVSFPWGTTSAYLHEKIEKRIQM